MAIVVIAATISSITAGMLNIVQANAEKSNPCIDNTDKTCQHYNNGNDKLVGSPHYPCCGGEATGDPHGQSQFNPEKGNPHCGAAEGCAKL